MKGCNGRCAGGIIVAIIFGALFLWTLVLAYNMQKANLWDYSVLPLYILALIFLAIAKWGKHWAMMCPHEGRKMEGGKTEKKK